MTSILWFRQDLRLADNHALTTAAGDGPLVALYVLDDETPSEDRIGGAQRWWLHHSLKALSASLAARRVSLILRRGRSEIVLAELAEETGASAVHATRAYEPWWQAADTAVADRLTLHLHDGAYLAPPETVRTGTGGRYRIFTPYWRALQAMMPPPAPLPVPKLTGIETRSDALDDWALLPNKPDWSAGFGIWTPGEDAALAALDTFEARVAAYDTARNLPSQAGSSALSPHLHFGEISPATIWHRLAGKPGAEPYLRELGWRDFTANTIHQFPNYAREHGRDHGVRFRTGKSADADFAAWSKGQTGYPIVDAGMRQLWATGWMHNRVRMIAASFLVKHLLIDWRRGERWFWDTLVDADYGNNSVNWQWIAGSGVDASLWSRMMAPLSQSVKFDAGDYIRRWVPELAGLSDKEIHDPHAAGVAPADYPAPLIGHREARARALGAR